VHLGRDGSSQERDGQTWREPLHVDVGTDVSRCWRGDRG